MESPAVSGIFHLAAAQTKENEQVSKINALVTGGTFMRILLVVVKSNWIFGGQVRIAVSCHGCRVSNFKA